MEKKRVILVALIALVIGCGASAVVKDLIVPPAAAQNVQQWEHFCAKIVWDEVSDGIFKPEIGAEGWEMASMLATIKGGMVPKTELMACFKRPKN